MQNGELIEPVKNTLGEGSDRLLDGVLVGDTFNGRNAITTLHLAKTNGRIYELSKRGDILRETILLNANVKGKSKNSLTVPKENWPHPRFREGLTAEELEDSEVPFYAYEHLSRGEKWYTLVSSPVYKSWTRSFVETVNRGGDSQYEYFIVTRF